jgi:hypothetical protein
MVTCLARNMKGSMIYDIMFITVAGADGTHDHCE